AADSPARDRRPSWGSSERGAGGNRLPFSAARRQQPIGSPRSSRRSLGEGAAACAGRWPPRATSPPAPVRPTPSPCSSPLFPGPDKDRRRPLVACTGRTGAWMLVDNSNDRLEEPSILIFSAQPEVLTERIRRASEKGKAGWSEADRLGNGRKEWWEERARRRARFRGRLVPLGRVPR